MVSDSVSSFEYPLQNTLLLLFIILLVLSYCSVYYRFLWYSSRFTAFCIFCSFAENEFYEKTEILYFRRKFWHIFKSLSNFDPINSIKLIWSCISCFYFFFEYVIKSYIFCILFRFSILSGFSFTEMTVHRNTGKRDDYLYSFLPVPLALKLWNKYLHLCNLRLLPRIFNRSACNYQKQPLKSAL